MSEPDAGSALTDLKTKGVVVRDKLVLNGTKRWCSGGGHSDACLVYCRLSDEPGAKATGAVLVENDTPGLTFGPNESLMAFAAFLPPTSTSAIARSHSITSSFPPGASAS